MIYYPVSPDIEVGLFEETHEMDNESDMLQPFLNLCNLEEIRKIFQSTSKNTTFI